MMQHPTSLAVSIAHSIQRLGRGVPRSGLRAIGACLASLSRLVAARAPGATRGRIAPAIGGLRAPVGTAPLPIDSASQAADLAEARLLADQWRDWAEACERRITDLEANLAASEMTALDLRSRLVCLQGKLATSNATARYQTLSLALEGRAAPSRAKNAAARAPGPA